MSTCLSSGLSTKKSLTLSASKSGSNRLHKYLDTLISGIDQGLTLSDAFETRKGLFPRFYVPVVKCGEESGRVLEAFNFLHDYCKKLDPTLRIVKKTWLYPVILIVFGWVIRASVFIYFGDYRGAFVLIQNTFIRYGVIVLLIHFLLKIRIIKISAEWIRLHLPVIRETEIDLSISLFFESFNLMYKTGGMHDVRMFGLASSTVGNSIIQKDFSKARKELEAGESFGDAFGKLKFLTRAYKETISVGTITGKLDESLDKITDMSTQALDFRLDILNKFLWRIIGLSVAMSIAWTIYVVVFASR